MNPYYLTGDGLGYPAFTNGGYSSAGSNTSSPAGVAGPSASGSTSASGTAPATGTASAPSGPSGGAGAASGSTTGNGGLLTGPLVHPHQDLNEFLESFWTRQMAGVEHETPDFKTYNLPLARIKKVMKSDEEVKMISAEGESRRALGGKRVSAAMRPPPLRSSGNLSFTADVQLLSCSPRHARVSIDSPCSEV